MASEEEKLKEALIAKLSQLQTTDMEIISRVVHELLAMPPLPSSLLLLQDDSLSQFVAFGLGHVSSGVRVFALGTVEKILKEIRAIKEKEEIKKNMEFLLKSGWVVKFVELITSNLDLSLAEKAVSLIVMIGEIEFAEDGAGLVVLNDPTVLESFSAAAHHKSFVHQMRIQWGFANMIGQSKQIGWKWGETTGLTDTIIKPLLTGEMDDDPLGMLSLFPNLLLLCENSEASVKLDESGAFKRLETLLFGKHPMLMDGSVECVMMIALAEAKINAPDSILNSTKVLDAFYQILIDPTIEEKSGVLHAIGKMGGASLKHLNFISSNVDLFKLFCSVGEMSLPGVSYLNQLEIKFIESLGYLLDIPKTSPPEHSEALQPIYQSVKGPNGIWFLEHVMSFRKAAIPMNRSVALHFSVCLAKHKWGIKELFAFAGFAEWVLNRMTENTKEGAEWKYQIVESLLEEKDLVKEVSSPVVVRDLMVYHKQGVFYGERKAQAAVADQFA